MTRLVTLRSITLDPQTGTLTGRTGHVELSDDACRVAERLMANPRLRLAEADMVASMGASLETCTVARLRRCVTSIAGALATMSGGRVRLRALPQPTYALEFRR